MKPGYKTTEFWLTVGHQVIALLLTLAVITNATAAAWDAVLGNAVVVVFMLLTGQSIVKNYADNRSGLKDAKTPDANQAPNLRAV